MEACLCALHITMLGPKFRQHKGAAHFFVGRRSGSLVADTRYVRQRSLSQEVRHRLGNDKRCLRGRFVGIAVYKSST